MTTVEDRVAALEGRAAALEAEVTTRRLVVVDTTGRPRLVAEVRGSTVELRLVVGSPPGSAQAAHVLVHASEGDDGLGPLLGLQLWAGGDALVELDAWPDAGGRWGPHLHVGDPH